MNHYKFFHTPLYSLFSQPFYQDVARHWKGLGFSYLILLQSICLALTFIGLFLGFSSFMEREAPAIISQIPPITIEDGRASTPQNQPIFITDPETEDELAVIDTSGEYTSLDQVDDIVILLLTETELIVRQDEYETRQFDLDQFESLMIDQDTVSTWVEIVGNVLFIVLYPFALVGYLIWRILQVLIYGAIGVFFARSMQQTTLSYSSAVRLACVAITPVLLIESASRLLGLPLVPGWWLFGLIVVLGYLFFAVYSAAQVRPAGSSSESDR